MVKRNSYTENPEEWLKHFIDLRGKTQIHLLKNAFEYYDGKTQTILSKGIGIADILLDLELDTETLAAAITYPALQAHLIHFDIVTENLGESGNKLLHDILQMQSISKLQHLQNRTLHQIENLRKMLLAMVTDIRAVLVILAERLWLLHQIKNADKTEQQKIAKETQEIFAPLANRLGIWQLKWEIEDLCLRYLQPDIYNQIATSLASRRVEREAYLARVIDEVSKMLTDAGMEHFKLSGRVKHIDSIYRKMMRKRADFTKIYDTSAIRVLVPEVKDCYNILSILQNKWEQVPQEFDDYIIQPKLNGYQSIHTVLIGPDSQYVEVQIRTEQMHHASELGIAAHWQYKEGISRSSDYENKIALLRQIMAWQKEIAHSEEKTEQPQQDIFADRVYVFTPTGDIIDLPKEATPLDFAYHIHSEVGHRCRGAKVDGKIVTLTYPLQTGETVEILTAKLAKPSRDWLNPHLNYLKSARARAKVQHWFRMKDNIQNHSLGREIFEKEMRRLRVDEKTDLESIAHKLNYKHVEDMFAALGSGDIRITHITNQLRPTNIPFPVTLAQKSKTETDISKIQIQGLNNLLTQIALCCKPLPGDSVVGYITRNRGISIHRSDCGNILNSDKVNYQRLIEVSWNENNSETYPVHLLLQTYDRNGLLRDITTLLAHEKINVLGLQTKREENSPEAEIYITLEIINMQQLKKALDLLHHVPNVLNVQRQ